MQREGGSRKDGRFARTYVVGKVEVGVSNRIGGGRKGYSIGSHAARTIVYCSSKMEQQRQQSKLRPGSGQSTRNPNEHLL